MNAKLATQMVRPTNRPRPLKTTKYAGRLWNLSPRSVARLAKAGLFRHVRIGRQILIPAEEVLRVTQEGLAPVRAAK